MVLINNLTIDEINAALLHLQRSQGEVVGGIKENTIQNISITNTSTGVDYSTQIERLEKNVENLQRVDEELKDKDREIIEKLDALGLIGIGIDNLDFDPTTRVLSIFTTNGEEYTTTLTSEEVSLTFDSTSNKLVFSMGEQTKEVTLPYINASEKGAANGVATLDATGRVPYSQLPESAMELKGEWNADTNTPTLKDGHGTNGDFYICNVGGTANFGTSENPRTITFYVNDRVIYQGNVAQWKRLPASEVRTVNGQSGDVTLNGTNVKYSDADNSPTLKDKIDTVEGYAKTQSDWGQTNTGAIDFIKNKPSLATVATSGSYNDLSNKPTIPAAQIQSDWSQSDTSAVDYIKNKPNLATVATSGSYNDLSNKPTIPAAQIQSDWTQTDSTKKDFIKNKIPIWITSGSADDNMSPIDSVTDGSMRPPTSNAVFDAIVGQSGTRAEITIGEVAWIKVCSIENWPRGDVLELYFQNDWATQGSSARKITITKGTTGSGGNYASWVNVTEEASDPQTLLSEIQICGANSTSSSDKVFVYVKYNKTTSNTIRMAYKSVGFNPPTVYMTKETPSGYALNLNYALHDKGVYINGVNMTPSYFLTRSQVIDSFQAEIGGIYFIYYSRNFNTTHGISSGASVILEQYSSSNIAYIGFVKATATTITMLGTGNIIYYKRLA